MKLNIHGKKQRFDLYFKFIKFYCLNRSSNLNLVRRFKLLIQSYNNLIDARVYSLYYKSFVSTKFNPRQKLDILIHQYSLLKDLIDTKHLEFFFKQGLVCWNDQREDECFDVLLKPASTFLREGCLALTFRHNGNDLFNLAFTSVPGKHLELEQPTVLFVSRIQYAINQFENISRITKLMGDSTPQTITLYVLEGICKAMNIEAIIGISTKQHIKFIDSTEIEIFDKNYNALWEKMEATKMSDGNYFMQCPYIKKPISSVKQKHRSRTLQKRERLDHISRTSTETLMKIFKNYKMHESEKLSISSHVANEVAVFDGE